LPKTRAQKEEILKDLTERVSKSKSLVFTDYKGMTMSQMQTLRQSLEDLSAQFSITKNNLLKIALKENGFKVDDDAVFEGPVATLFAYGDEIAPIKALTKAFKDAGIGKTKAGFLADEFLTDAKVKQLADLPSKEELRAKVVGSLGAPLYGIVGVLQANLRNLVYALEQIRKQKGGE
jgi:large subunit ribosomal protein L10